MTDKQLELIAPGEILLEEFLIPMNLSQNRFARSIGVSPSRVNEIVKGKSGNIGGNGVTLRPFLRHVGQTLA